MRASHSQRVKRLAENFRREQERQANLSPAERAQEAAFWRSPAPERPPVPVPLDWVQPVVGGLQFQPLAVGGEAADKPVQWHRSDGGWFNLLHVQNVAVTRTGANSATMFALFQRLKPAASGDAQRQRLTLGAQAERRLNEGLPGLEGDLTAAVAQLLPPGPYMVTLMTLRPVRVQPGDANDFLNREAVGFWGGAESAGFSNEQLYFRSPGWSEGTTVTYRGGTTVDAVDLGICLLVPTQADDRLNPERVAHYVRAIGRGQTPTVFTLQVLEERDSNSTSGSDPVLGNMALSVHHVLDGHHKLHAATLVGGTVTALTFTALGLTPSHMQDQFRSRLHRHQALLARWDARARGEDLPVVL